MAHVFSPGRSRRPAIPVPDQKRPPDSRPETAPGKHRHYGLYTSTGPVRED